MRKIFLFLCFSIFSFSAILVSCEEDDITQKVITPSNVSAVVNAIADGSGTVTVTPTAEGANSFLITFEEGVSFVVKVGESATHTYAASGTYEITIVAYGQGLGNATTTQSVTVVIDADPNEAVFGTWVMANEAGSLGVGPAPGDISWFAIDGTGLTQRSCYFNDTYVFGEDGSFMNVLGDDTWLEGWQSGAADACGAPVAPHDGSASATYAYDPTAGTLTLSGAGAYLGLPKAVNEGELPNVAVPDAITYDVTLSEDGETMNVVIESGTGVYWQYKMVKGDGSDVGSGGDPLETVFTNLVWADEFDTDGAPDPANWAYDLGNGDNGWGNGEVQSYTDDPSNVIVEGGNLKITARAESSTGEGIYYFDDFQLWDAGGMSQSIFQDFEGTAPTFTDFGGAFSEVIANPDMSGINMSATVGQTTKPQGSETFAASFFDLAAPLDVPTNPTITVKTWSPIANAVVRLKIEDSTNGANFAEIDATTTVAGAWEELTFDFSGAGAFSYDRVVIFFDFGNPGTAGPGFSSARIKTEGLHAFTYGRVEARAKLPTGGGTWPAIWMLGADYLTNPWPAAGEMDVMEHVGNSQDVVFASTHDPNNFGGNARTGSTIVEGASDEFHVYEMEWTDTEIKFAVDGIVFHTVSNDGTLPFNKDFFFILNVAMGGSFGGAIDPAFTESSMEVDYIRFYQ